MEAQVFRDRLSRFPGEPVGRVESRGALKGYLRFDGDLVRLFVYGHDQRNRSAVRKLFALADCTFAREHLSVNISVLNCHNKVGRTSLHLADLVVSMELGTGGLHCAGR